MSGLRFTEASGIAPALCSQHPGLSLEADFSKTNKDRPGTGGPCSKVADGIATRRRMPSWHSVISPSTKQSFAWLTTWRRATSGWDRLRAIDQPVGSNSGLAATSTGRQKNSHGATAQQDDCGWLGNRSDRRSCDQVADRREVDACQLRILSQRGRRGEFQRRRRHGSQQAGRLDGFNSEVTQRNFYRPRGGG